jgi:starch-binding outer membrane protein, SusD/RagB family
MTQSSISSFFETVGRSRRLTWVVAAAGLLGTTACDLDRLLRIETPSRVAEDPFLVPENAALIASSSAADFECALGAYIVTSALAAGEFAEGTQTASRWSYDRRSVEAREAHYATFGCATIGVYTPINTAVYTNDQAARLLAGWTDAQVPNRQRLLAQSAAFAGYSLILLAEGFCSGVIAVGPELTPTQIFDSAVVRFNVAITAAQAANDATLLNLARVGMARALRGKGDLAAAATFAAQVPANFVYSINGSTTAARRNNRIFAQNNSASAVTVAPAYRNLMVDGVPDTRVVAIDAGNNTSDQINRLWRQQKYASLTAPTPVATGIEAQLILAEAQGGTAGFTILENLRTAAGLPALTDAERANFQATLLEERNRWLWLQGSRWFDLRRTPTLPLVPAPGTPYAKGGVYGDQRCWPLPDVEKFSNPNL